MERQNFKSVTRKLVLSLLSALLVTFCLLSVSIYFSSKKYIHDNAFNNAAHISINIIRTLDRRIIGIEQIPPTLYNFLGPYRKEELQTLPSKILYAYPYLNECFISLDSSILIHAVKVSRDSLICRRSSYPTATDSNYVFRKNSRGGYWTFLHRNKKQHICYCSPLSEDNKENGMIGFIFPTDRFIDFAGEIKLYNSGHIFFTDFEGETIFTPDQDSPDDIHEYFSHPGSPKNMNAFLKGKTGSTTVLKNNRKHFLFFTPVSHLNWRLCIIYPYDEILIISNKFYGLLLVICGFAMLLLIVMTFWIARQISRPLKLFTGYARKIKNGQPDARIMAINSNDEFGELRDAFRYMQQNMDNYAEKLKVSRDDNEKIQTEIRLAQKLQQRFLPRPILLPDNIELKGELQQSKSVGGDLYEYFLINNLLYFAIGDVSGKGIPAALYMASVVKLFRYVASRQTSTAAICNTINTYMSDNSDDDMYVTMFVGIMDVNTGEITFTNAGQPEPFIIHPNQQISQLKYYSDSPIGILENYSYSEYKYRLENGSQILLYTDGITDAEDKFAQFYGKNKLIDSIHKSPSPHPRDIINSILQDLHKHLNETEPSDDFTVLSILYKKK